MSHKRYFGCLLVAMGWIPVVSAPEGDQWFQPAPTVREYRLYMANCHSRGHQLMRLYDSVDLRG